MENDFIRRFYFKYEFDIPATKTRKKETRKAEFITENKEQAERVYDKMISCCNVRELSREGF